LTAPRGVKRARGTPAPSLYGLALACDVHGVDTSRTFRSRGGSRVIDLWISRSQTAARTRGPGQSALGRDQAGRLDPDLARLSACDVGIARDGVRAWWLGAQIRILREPGAQRVVEASAGVGQQRVAVDHGACQVDQLSVARARLVPKQVKRLHLRRWCDVPSKCPWHARSGLGDRTRRAGR
jgi:hypothetical protein